MAGASSFGQAFLVVQQFTVITRLERFLHMSGTLAPDPQQPLG